jgi:hypothetical protein
MGMMHIPKKLKWNSLSEFKQYLERETTEKVVRFEGYVLVTETTEYGLLDGVLNYREVKKNESKGIKGRSNGTTADKERMGTHGRSDNAKPNGKKAGKVRATKVPKKVSKPSKSPK